MRTPHAPPCDIGGVRLRSLMRILSLRQQFGPSASTVLSEFDLKEAYRQALVHPARTAQFGCMFGDIVVVDLCLGFGRRSRPGFWGLLGAALEYSNNNTSSFTHAVMDIGRRDTLPPDCKTVPGVDGKVGDPFLQCIYANSILVGVQYSPDGRRSLCSSRFSSSDHYRLLGGGGVDDPLLDTIKCWIGTPDWGCWDG